VCSFFLLGRTLNGLNCADVSLNNIHPSVIFLLGKSNTKKNIVHTVNPFVYGKCYTNITVYNACNYNHNFNTSNDNSGTQNSESIDNYVLTDY